MDYKVTLSLSARRDLADIVRYISFDALERAIEFGQFLIRARLNPSGTASNRIACRESGRRQFNATGMPLLGPGGDVGVMQLGSMA